ncbi:hypothetical protein ACFOD4_00465 [Pseudoroseomonas globiformis]|uniref:RepB-like DNA primase domain-containing protein n=1 Tax=Teichococcus globiformis TaxID=2307229 RepID=A0ABV7FW77_9PROT
MIGGEFPSHIQPTAFEQRGLAERVRADAILSGLPASTRCAGAPAPLTAPAWQDVEAGLRWTLETVGPTTIVAIKPDGPTAGMYLDHVTLPDVVPWATTRNNAEWNLYFHVNQPRSGLAKKAAKADIVAIRAAAFLDIDAKGGRNMEEALAAITALPLPPPSVIIASGGGYQPIWLLAAPMPPELEVVARVESLGRRLEPLAGSDHVSHIDRLLRLPFTMNHPNAAKRAAGRGVSFSGLL